MKKPKKILMETIFKFENRLGISKTQLDLSRLGLRAAKDEQFSSSKVLVLDYQVACPGGTTGGANHDNNHPSPPLP